MMKNRWRFWLATRLKVPRGGNQEKGKKRGTRGAKKKALGKKEK